MCLVSLIAPPVSSSANNDATNDLIRQLNITCLAHICPLVCVSTYYFTLFTLIIISPAFVTSKCNWLHISFALAVQYTHFYLTYFTSLLLQT